MFDAYGSHITGLFLSFSSSLHSIRGISPPPWTRMMGAAGEPGLALATRGNWQRVQRLRDFSDRDGERRAELTEEAGTMHQSSLFAQDNSSEFVSYVRHTSVIR